MHAQDPGNHGLSAWMVSKGIGKVANNVQPSFGKIRCSKSGKAYPWAREGLVSCHSTNYDGELPGEECSI